MARPVGSTIHKINKLKMICASYNTPNVCIPCPNCKIMRNYYTTNKGIKVVCKYICGLYGLEIKRKEFYISENEYAKLL